MNRLDSFSNNADIPEDQKVLLPYDFENDKTLFSPDLDRARINLDQGSYEIAYNQFKALESSKLSPQLALQLKSYAFTCMHNISNIFLIESLENLRQDIMQFRRMPHESGESIRQLCIRLIHFKYNHSDESHSLQQIASDSFLLDCLANDYFPDPEIEKFLTDIRRQLLLSSVQNLEIKESYLPLYQALSLQGYLTDYAFFVQHDEQVVVESLNEELAIVLSAQECQLNDITNMMLLLSMYGPLIETSAHPAIQGLQTGQLPQFLQSIYDLTYLEPLDIQKKANEIVTLGTINERSQQVRQQYEESPYPKLGRLHFAPKPARYKAHSPHLQDENLNLEVLDQEPLEILVAGCGTGFHPLQIAKSYKGTNVTAIDISATSLAFAERLKSAYGIRNIQFFQADILELPKIFHTRRQRFHVIECLGVLHHMDNMESGLAALSELLVPGGILHLGLYSKIARANIHNVRAVNEKQGFQATPASIRQFRKELMDSDADNPIKPLLYSKDFYNLNGCRDLLFNTQETCLDLLQVKQLLQSQGMEFLGFNFSTNHSSEKYRSMFPADEEQRNLDYWHQLEQQHPDSFKQMYRFHCQKPL